MKISLIVSGLFFTCLLVCSPVYGQQDNINGDWRLDSIQVKTDEIITKLSGPVPKEIYYTCPVRIEAGEGNKSTFYFNNKETKIVLYTIDKTNNTIHFSFQGQGSVPEYQFSCILEEHKTPTILQLHYDYKISDLNSPKIRHTYFYSLK